MEFQGGTKRAADGGSHGQRAPRRLWAAIAGVVTTAAAMLPAGSVAAESAVRIIEVPGASSTDVAAINDIGTIAGRFDDVRPGGFVRTTDGRFETFRIHDAGAIIVADLDDAGTTVGSFTTGSERRGFLRSNDGSFTTVRIPGSSMVHLEGINDAGVAIGHSRSATGRTTSFLREPDGVRTVIELPSSTHTVAQAINDRGDVAGFYETGSGAPLGFVRLADGSVRTFSTPTGGGLSISAIDDEGNIVGWYADRNEVRRAFVRSADDDFVTVLPSGATESVAADFDDEGRAAGYYRDADGTLRGFVRSASGALTVFAPNAAIATSITAIGGDGTIVGSLRVEGAAQGFLARVDTTRAGQQQPATPRGLRAESTDLAVDLHWMVSTESAALTHMIYRSTDGSLGQLIATVGDASYHDDSVKPGSTYTYAVKSVGSSGVPSWRSNLATVTVGPSVGDNAAAAAVGPDDERPTPPRGLRAIARPWGIELTWFPSQDNVGVTDYVIHRSTDGSVGEAWRTVPGGQLFFPHGRAEPGVSYTYTVRARDAAGNVSWRSNLGTATLD